MKEKSVPGLILWRRGESSRRAKALLVFISLVLLVIAEEAIRVSLVGMISGHTPKLFGAMATRSMQGLNGAGAIVLSLFAVAFVGYRLIQTIFVGMPDTISIVSGQAAAQSPVNPADTDLSDPVFRVHYDGSSSVVRFFRLRDIAEIDSVVRASFFGGGHQVRVKMRGKRMSAAVAFMDSSEEAETLRERLWGMREAAFDESAKAL